jgi:hypothetical protein
MAQKTNLNVSPYYDDFNSSNNYYKVLFNPGKPIQARELTTLQSTLQDQLEKFGSNTFKNGSMVVPGGTTYDSNFCAVQLNPTLYGVDITTYINNLIGITLTGQSSGVTASVQYVQLPNNDEVNNITIYVKYRSSDSNFVINPFQDGELLFAQNDNISTTSGTVINAGTPLVGLISSNATSTGSAVSIADGVYFIRGYFVNVSKQTIILDYYDNVPSYRIGLLIGEEIVTAYSDKSLYDNAKGFSNYSAPGADRFKINLTLSKKLLTDLDDTDFVELFRVIDGKIQQTPRPKDPSNNLRDYLAKRTYDEAGNFSVTPYTIKIQNSLNDLLGNDGIYLNSQKTNQANTPSKDLMCVNISPGISYVRGYDVYKDKTTILDSPKPRDTKTVSFAEIPFQLGSTFRINNVSGNPAYKANIALYNNRKGTSVPTGLQIGDARVYMMNLNDSATSGINSSPATKWGLYLYDIQTYTQLTLNQTVSSADLPSTSYVKGVSSGASGYATVSGNGLVIFLRQVSGTFQVGEQILINGLTPNVSRTISSIRFFDTKDIKSVHQSTAISGFSIAFSADVNLEKITATGFTPTDLISIDQSGNVTCPGRFFTGITSDTVIRYQRPGFTTETFNRVISVSPTGQSMTLTGISTVSGVCDGAVGFGVSSVNFSIGSLVTQNNGPLYAQLPNSPISSVNLTGSNITVSSQITSVTSSGLGTVTFNLSNVTGISSAFFLPFNNQRYSIFYSDGTTDTLTSDKFSLSGNNVTISGLSPSKTIVSINSTLIKNNIQSRIKTFTRSQTLNVNLSKYPQSGTGINTSVNNGLTYNQFYGLRVEDEEISLNVPDVVSIVAIYESLTTSAPTLDQITFNSVANVSNNALIGENIVGQSSGAVARIVTKPSSNILGIVYLNANRFSLYETVTFLESNISAASVQAITPGLYKDIRNNYSLNKNQKDQYYDYSKIVRNTTTGEPSHPLLIVYDYYTVPSNDTGDLFTVLSYDNPRYESDIPNIGNNNVRASDVLDFRPAVIPFTGISSSPFDFSSRFLTPKTIITPNEGSLIGYSYYLGRIDKIVLDKNGNFVLLNGTSSDNPSPPSTIDEVMEVATITLPPYLFYPQSASITYSDNKRYTMRDIGTIDNRVTNLETTTSLSLLEVNTQSLQIQDAQGNNRFKSGIFVDNFTSTSFIDSTYSNAQIDSNSKLLTPIVSVNSLDSQIAPSLSTPDVSLDLSTDFTLIDPNVVKRSNTVLLNYNEVPWINQPLTTQVENVNPFNIVQYTGNITLSPAADSWVTTVNLDQIYVNIDQKVKKGDGPGHVVYVGISSSVSSSTVLISSTDDLYMRSRNTEFRAKNLKPSTQFYQFLDSVSGVDFVPKLVEIATDSTLQNYGSVGTFQVGETVIGTYNNNNLITFRVATPNHKEGTYNSPSRTYNANPYAPSESVPSSYSASSKILNVDTYALSAQAQGLYSGYLVQGMRLVGQTSGATAYVKNLRLISDVYGDLIGTFFLRDPLTNPPPAIRISTGTKTYVLNSNSTNLPPIAGDQTFSTASVNYTSAGITSTFQTTVTTTTTNYYVDPIAQTFVVGANNSSSPVNAVPNDVNGAFITSADIYFYSKDSGNAPVTLEIRTVNNDNGTPTATVLGRSKTLTPDLINIPTNIVRDSQQNITSVTPVATNFKFDYPIYLAPGNQYALVLISPNSDAYEVFIAEMNKSTFNGQNFNLGQGGVYSQQYSLGSFFRSQNGSLWTANQYQDMMFKLYKADFSSSMNGTAYFYNPTLDTSNGYVTTLDANAVTTFTRNLSVGITTVTNSSMIGILTTGRKVSDSSKIYNYGNIVNTGGAAATIGITTGGINYTTQSNVSTYALTGNGSGLTLSISGVGTITSATIVNAGNGYVAGDIVGIVTSSAGGTGNGSQITVTTISGVDTLYLSNVQGNSFTSGQSLVYYNNSGSPISLASTTIRSSTVTSGYNTGTFIGVNHFDHGMYSTSNYVTLNNVKSNVSPTTLTTGLSASATSISIASTSNFTTFEGVSIGSTNPGYVKIDNEIIKYTTVGVNQLSGITRGIDSTLVQSHDNSSQVYKYELSGVSIRRINTTFNIDSIYPSSNGYYLQVGISTNGIDRSSDNIGGSNWPQLAFSNQSSDGGDQITATRNIQFDSLVPNYAIITPGSSTSASASIRTVSGTSMGGNESSFIDQGFEPVQLNVLNKLSTTRIVCSKVNETNYLSSLPRNKSFTTAINLSTTDNNLSPVIYLDNATTEFHSNRVNQPITNYSLDGRVNSFNYDPNAAVYVSVPINLAQPARGLKVIISAYRDASADFRVLYSLITSNVSSVNQSFYLFPGYDNLRDTTGDGYGDTIINPANNDGLPDAFVRSSNSGEYLEYQFTADNLSYFNGYRIKIVMTGTNQALSPAIKSIQSIAIL